MSIVTVTTEQVHELIQQLAAQTVAASITPEMVANIFENMRQLNDQERLKVIAVAEAYIEQIRNIGIDADHVLYTDKNVKQELDKINGDLYVEESETHSEYVKDDNYEDSAANFSLSDRLLTNDTKISGHVVSISVKVLGGCHSDIYRTSGGIGDSLVYVGTLTNTGAAGKRMTLDVDLTLDNEYICLSTMDGSTVNIKNHSSSSHLGNLRSIFVGENNLVASTTTNDSISISTIVEVEVSETTQKPLKDVVDEQADDISSLHGEVTSLQAKTAYNISYKSTNVGAQLDAIDNDTHVVKSQTSIQTIKDSSYTDENASGFALKDRLLAVNQKISGHVVAISLKVKGNSHTDIYRTSGDVGDSIVYVGTLTNTEAAGERMTLDVDLTLDDEYILLSNLDDSTAVIHSNTGTGNLLSVYVDSNDTITSTSVNLNLSACTFVDVETTTTVKKSVKEEISDLSSEINGNETLENITVDFTTYTDGAAVASNGTILEQSGLRLTDYISLNGIISINYHLYCPKGVWYAVSFWDEDYGYVSGNDYPASSAVVDDVIDDIPISAKYVRFSWNPTKVTPEATLVKQTGSAGIANRKQPTFVSKWQGKKILMFGDSFVDYCNYPSALAKLTGAKIINRGIGGSTITRQNAPRKNYSLICRLKEEEGAITSGHGAALPSSCDLVIVHAGVNDYASSMLLGDIADGIADAKDNRIYNAIQIILNTLRSKYPSTPIVWGTPCHIASVANPEKTDFTYGNDGSLIETLNSSNYTLQQVVTAIKECCALYSVPVIDYYAESGIVPEIEANKNLYTAGSNAVADGIHPSHAGAAKMALLAIKVIENV